TRRPTSASSFPTVASTSPVTTPATSSAGRKAQHFPRIAPSTRSESLCKREDRVPPSSKLKALLSATVFFVSLAHAQTTRIPLPNSNFPISQGVWVGDSLYLSGMMASTLSSSTPGDTKDQTISTIQQIQKALEAQKLTLADVVMMHVYLAGDPAKGGKMD